MNTLGIILFIIFVVEFIWTWIKKGIGEAILFLILSVGVTLLVYYYLSLHPGLMMLF